MPAPAKPEPSSKTDRLPPEEAAISKVLSYLPFVPDRFRLERVCKTWRRLLNDPSLDNEHTTFDDQYPGLLEPFEARYHFVRANGATIKRVIERSKECALIALNPEKKRPLFESLTDVLRKNPWLCARFVSLSIAEGHDTLLLNLSKFVNLRTVDDRMGVVFFDELFPDMKIESLRVPFVSEVIEYESRGFERFAGKLKFLRVDFGPDACEMGLFKFSKDWYAFSGRLEILCLTVHKKAIGMLWQLLDILGSGFARMKKVVVLGVGVSAVKTLPRLKDVTLPRGVDVYMFCDSGPNKFSKDKMLSLMHDDVPSKFAESVKQGVFTAHTKGTTWYIVDFNR